MCFDFSFFAAVGIFLALDKSGYGAFALLACLCHEAGHLAVMLLKKEPPAEMIFSGGGICIKQSREASTAVLAAGCVVNAVLFLIFFFVLPPDSIFKLMFGGANMAAGVFNLLPLGELDGRFLTEKLCFRLLPYSAALKTMRWVQAGTGILLCVVLIWLFVSRKINPIAVCVMGYIFLVDFLLKNR